MKIILEPTPELYDAPINGVQIPVRIWRGITEGGVAIEAYVLSITPDDGGDSERLRAELPPFMVRSRERYAIDTRSEAERRADNIYRYGTEGEDQ